MLPRSGPKPPVSRGWSSEEVGAGPLSLSESAYSRRLYRGLHARRPSVAPRSPALPAGRGLLLFAGRDGQVPGAGAHALPGGLGPLCRADAGHHPHRLATRWRWVLAHAPLAHAARALAMPRPRHL